MNCPMCGKDNVSVKSVEVKIKTPSGISKKISVTACSRCAGAKESFGCWFGCIGGLIGLALWIAVIVSMSHNYSPATDPFCIQNSPGFIGETYITYLCSPNPFVIIPTIMGVIIGGLLLNALSEKIWTMTHRRKLQNHPDIKNLVTKGWKL